jgi:hypothetical protein
MQDLKQRRIDDQGLRLAHQLGEDLPPQGLQKAPQLPHAPVERGRIEPHYPRERVREEPFCVAQEGALALHPTKLLREGEGDHLRVREPLEGFVASGMRVEQSVGVVYEAEEHDKSLFQAGEGGGMLGLGHLLLLAVASRMALFLLPNHATDI